LPQFPDVYRTLGDFSCLTFLFVFVAHFPMHFLSFLTVLPVLVTAQGKPGDGCPKLSKSSPSMNKPKNCPDPKTVPSVKGTLRDNECLVAGIVGVNNLTALLFT
jgi:hypothetical protein